MAVNLKTLVADVRCIVRDGTHDIPEWVQAGSNSYDVTMIYQGRRMTVPFFMGPGCDEGPDAEGVMYCLMSDASSADQNFEGWRADLGLDSDSRNDERIYKACQKIQAKLKRLLGGDFETFLYAERD